LPIAYCRPSYKASSESAWLILQVTAAYATASNEVLLQHYGFVDVDNAHDEYKADILSFIEENVVDQPNEEQLQDVHASPALKTALSQVLTNLAHAQEQTASVLLFLENDVGHCCWLRQMISVQ
jgi:hypothetical protein